MSMAIRYDHALGMPGYYDSQNRLFGNRGGLPEPTHAMRLASTLIQMRQIWEEVAGQGFYSPEREANYAAMCEGVDLVATADRQRLLASS